MIMMMPPPPPSKVLEDCLDKLLAKLKELALDNSGEFQRLNTVLARITDPGTEPNDFTRNLKELAEVVIDMRTHPSTPAMRELPVPPYDLWLPFKARDLTPSDSKDLEAAKQILNEKVRALSEITHSKSTVTQLERSVQEPKSIDKIEV